MLRVPESSHESLSIIMRYALILLSVLDHTSRFLFLVEKETSLRSFDSGRTCRRARSNPQQIEKSPARLEIFLFVAGSGIEPESGGYAYHYSFRYSINRFGVWTIPLSFCLRKVRYLPSSLYTFRNNFLLRLGSVLPCSQFASKRRFHRIWKEFHSAFLRMSPLEPPEVPLL